MKEEKMKKLLIIFLFVAILLTGSQLLLSQEEKEDPRKELSAELLKTTQPPYSAEGRRDPFRDLLAGRDVEEQGPVTGISQMSVDNVNLIGIVKIEGKFIAIINSSKGFPFNIRVNDRLADGFVLSIEERRVVFRKTKERGITLIKPEDIVKEIKIEGAVI